MLLLQPDIIFRMHVTCAWADATLCKEEKNFEMSRTTISHPSPVPALALCALQKLQCNMGCRNKRPSVKRKLLKQVSSGASCNRQLLTTGLQERSMLPACLSCLRSAAFEPSALLMTSQIMTFSCMHLFHPQLQLCYAAGLDGPPRVFKPGQTQ